MRRKFIQDAETGKLREVKPLGAFGHPGTFQVGDLPDIQKDCDRRRTDENKRFKQERLQTIVDIVNSQHN